MAAPTGSEVPVKAPPLMPPITGLLAQAEVVSGAKADRWLQGQQWVPEPSENVDFDDLCSVRVQDTPDDLVRFGIVKNHPFVLLLRDRCSTWGWPQNDWERRVTDALEAKRHWGVEQEFERGTINSSNLHLAATYSGPDITTVTLGGGLIVSAINAMGLLDEAIAQSANNIGRGMIHADPFVISLWKAAGLLTYETTGAGPTTSDFGAMALAVLGKAAALSGDGGMPPGEAMLSAFTEALAETNVAFAATRKTQIYSPKGNVVIAGNGYQGRSPVDGLVPAAHASRWAYATDWVQVVAGTPKTTPKTFQQALDITRNLVVYKQEQWFATKWSGLLHAAVQVSTPTPAVP